MYLFITHIFIPLKVVEDEKKKREDLIKIFREHLNNKYDNYALAFFLCEQLNTAIVILQWFIANNFLKYQFARYI